MEHLSLIGTVTLIHLLAVISPGPDFVVAIRNSLSYSRKTGIWTAWGFGLGVFVHLFYCIAGLGFIISQSTLIFNIIKFLGVGYLFFIGVRSFFSKSSHITVEKEKYLKDISPLRAIKVGFLTNVLNPKATLFFLSLFSFVISPDTPNLILITLGAIMIFSTIFWFCLVALFFTQKRIRNAFEKFQGVFNKILGGTLIGVALKIIFTEK